MSERDANLLVDEWNKNYPVGTRVKYKSVKDDADGIESETRSPAWTMCGSYPAVLIKNKAGGVLLDHLEVIGE